VKTPDAAAVARIERGATLLPDLTQRTRTDLFAGLDIKQSAATRAYVKARIEIELGATLR
jgi:hypothetical protein